MMLLTCILFVFNYKINKSAIYLFSFLLAMSLYGLLHYYILLSQSIIGIAVMYGHFMPVFYLMGPLLYLYIKSTLNDEKYQLNDQVKQLNEKMSSLAKADKMSPQAPSAYDMLMEQRMQIVPRIQQLQDDQYIGKEAYRLYKNLGGEAESRLTQATFTTESARRYITHFCFMSLQKSGATKYRY